MAILVIATVFVAVLLNALGCSSLLTLTSADRALTTSQADSSRKTLAPDTVWVTNPTSLEQMPHVGSTYRLIPGFYTGTQKTFCLHAGGGGSDDATAYLPAPFKGTRADLIYGVVARYHREPELVQVDVQLLLWGLLAGVPVSQMSPAVQGVATKLLTVGELARAEELPEKLGAIAFDEAMAAAPTELRSGLEVTHRLQDLLTQGTATYEEIQRIAVPPKSVPRSLGTWAWADGYWIRYFPESYSKTRLEVWVPQGPPVQVNLARLIAVPGQSFLQRLGIGPPVGGGDGRNPNNPFRDPRDWKRPKTAMTVSQREAGNTSTQRASFTRTTGRSR